jgi:hypothetical protein
MSGFFSDLKQETMQFIVGMDRNEWLVAFGILVVIGIFCMRGFGSRTSY